MTKQQFLTDVAPTIQRIANEKGYRFPSAIIAQAIVESGWGGSLLSSRYYNFFGMKCGSSWNGHCVDMKTQEEYTIGVMSNIRDKFRVYHSIEEGIRGYFDFITMTRYQNLKNANSPEEYIQLLKQDGWATSSQYINSLTSILHSNNLKSYDNVQAPVAPPVSPKQSIEEVARRVIKGEYGNGATRRSRLEAEGYNYREVQNMVNSML